MICIRIARLSAIRSAIPETSGVFGAPICDAGFGINGRWEPGAGTIGQLGMSKEVGAISRRQSPVHLAGGLVDAPQEAVDTTEVGPADMGTGRCIDCVIIGYGLDVAVQSRVCVGDRCIPQRLTGGHVPGRDVIRRGRGEDFAPTYSYPGWTYPGLVVGNLPVYLTGRIVNRPDIVSVVLQENIIPHDYGVS